MTQQQDKEIGMFEYRIEQCGLEKKIQSYNEPAKRYRKELLRTNSRMRHEAKKIVDFIVRREVVKNILENDILELAKWVTDPSFFEDVHRVAYDFVDKGIDVIPDSWKQADTYRAKYSDDATIVLHLLPRGLGKTNNLCIVRCLHEIIKDPYAKWLMIHSREEKAIANLHSLKSMMMNPYLAIVFPQLFADSKKKYIDRGGRITSKKINISTQLLKEDYDASDFRKEATISVGSLKSDFIGMHVEGIFGDDLVTLETSKNEDQREKLAQFFNSLGGLREYRKDGKKFMIYLVGTEYYDNSLYHDIYERDNVTFLRMPCDWWVGDRHYRLAERFTDEYLSQQKSILKSLYDSQMRMLPIPLEDDNLDIRFNKDRDVIDLTREELEYMKACSVIVTACDPAYSKRNKRQGDGKSRATITSSLYYEGVWYVFDCWQSFGEDNDSWTDIVYDKLVNNQADCFVQDAHGTQIGLFESMVNVFEKNKLSLRTFPVTAKLTAGAGKIEIANGILSEMFTREEVKIVNTDSCNLVMRELTRESSGLDIIDTLAYTFMSIHPEIELPIALARKKGRQRNKKISFLGRNKFITGRTA